MPKPKGSSSTFKRMTAQEVNNYQEYHRRYRLNLPQDEHTRSGNTAYAKAKRNERLAKQREEQIRGESS
jgi:hypothetical protein